MVTEAEVEIYTQEKEENVKKNPHIRELRERIDGMVGWRTEVDYAVHLHRKEQRRLGRALGIRDKSWSERKTDEREEHWGVGGRTWEKGW